MARRTHATRALGEFTITSLYDGFAAAPSATLVRVGDKIDLANEWRVFRQTRKLLIRADVLAFLIDTGNEKVLIDAGGGGMIPTMGAARKNLIAAGHDPAEVSRVLITHPHPDHVCGIAIKGEMTYPNALIYLERRDYEHWVSPEHGYKQLREVLAPYLAADRVVFFEPGERIADGITAVPLPGHTTGHTGFAVTSAGEQALFWGDIVHDFDYQLDHPDCTFVLRDLDPGRVVDEIVTQQRVLAEASETGELIFAPHAPFPGIGRVRASGDGYRWEPVASRAPI